jgi:hypothetical protein
MAFGNCETSFVSMASKPVKMEMQRVFPEGSRFVNSMFPGLNITFDGLNEYFVRKGRTTVSLNITVLDVEKAKASLKALKYLFGNVNIELKPGAVTQTGKTIQGLEKESFSERVDANKDDFLYSYLVKISSLDPYEEDFMATYIKLIMELEEALLFAEEEENIDDLDTFLENYVVDNWDADSEDDPGEEKESCISYHW